MTDQTFRSLLRGAAMAAIMLVSAAAKATPLVGTLGFVITAAPAIDMTNGVVNFGAGLTTYSWLGSGGGDFASISGTGTISGQVDFSTTVGAILNEGTPTLTIGGFTFTPTEVQTQSYVLPTGNSTSESLTLYSWGAIAGSSNPASLTITFNKTGSSVFTAAGTLATPAPPPTPVPEPAMLAVLGMGLCGLIVVRRAA